MLSTRYPEVLKFIDGLEELEQAERVWDSLLAFTSQSGLPYGEIIDIPGPAETLEEATLCVRYPEEWRRRYIRRNYIRKDPVILHLLRTSEPYTWTEVLEFPDYTKAQRRVRQEAAEFGLREGYVVPIVGLRTGTAIVQFAGAAADLGTHARAELRLAAIYAHARIRALSATVRRTPPPAPLTLRERECLQWVAVGKSDWEIGEILSISEKTANFHVEQVKRKYNVATRVQAVVQAIRAGAIQP